MLDIPAEDVVRKDRLRPGKMLLVDTVKGELVDDDKLKADYASRQPYGEWLDRNLVNLRDLKVPNKKVPDHTKEELVQLQKAFGYRYEDVSLYHPADGQKTAVSLPVPWAVTPLLAVLSHTHPLLFEYFSRCLPRLPTLPSTPCARRSSPPPPSMSVPRATCWSEDAENCKVLKIENPILTDTDLLKIKAMDVPGFKIETLSICYYKNTDLEKAIDRLFVDVDRAYRDGANILILSDRDIDEYHVAIPSLLAVGAVSKYLVRTRKRTSMALILESGEPRLVHDFATLLGSALRPSTPIWRRRPSAASSSEGLLDKDYYAAVEDYNKAVLAGIVKIASKMGISTIQSYAGSQIFEALGLSQEVVDKYFTNTVSRVGGITIHDIQNDLEARHQEAFDPLGLDINRELPSLGAHKFRQRPRCRAPPVQPQTIHLLQQACWTGNYDTFKQYTAAAATRTAMPCICAACWTSTTRRSACRWTRWSVDSIVKRFQDRAMSYGSFSQEAHECMAIAMNRLGGKSNTGEGGEDAEDRLAPSATPPSSRWPPAASA